ncbi:MAG: alpha-ribazole phosphatase [Coriobacteriia bacterium]
MRHPETVANAERRYVGHGDSPFTRRGEAQAADLVVALSEWRPVRVYTSPLQRAMAVAVHVAGCGVPLLVREGLAEVDFGPAEGLTFEEISALGMAVEQPGLPAPDGKRVVGEAWDTFYSRVRSAAEEMVAEEGRTAVIAHGGVVRALVAHLLELPHEAAWRLRVGNATGARIRIDDGYASLLGFGVPACGFDS